MKDGSAVFISTEPKEAQENENGGSAPQMPENGVRPESPDKNGEETDHTGEPEAPAESERNASWLQAILNAIRNYLRSLFG